MTELATIHYNGTGKSTKANKHGMRPMQSRAWEKRDEQFLLIKSPPASGKSRAVMYIILDKLRNQKRRKAIVTVPQSVIGGSFASEPLSKSGFTEDWVIEPKWDLCDSESPDNGKVKAVEKFLDSDDKNDRILLCAHATFRLAISDLGIERFDDCVIALDEVHHASADKRYGVGANKLGMHVGKLIDRGKVHIIAMTGTFFRGDTTPVLAEADEYKFKNVVFTGHEQLDGYDHLKALVIEHTFYNGEYSDTIMKVVDPEKKSIIYIPHVNALDTNDKSQDVDILLDKLGSDMGRDEATGFRLLKCRKTKRTLRVADLVDDVPEKRRRVVDALRDRSQMSKPDYVDIIIALNMAKEGFDWIWAEHAVAIGHRSSLTEVVQMMGRVTRDAKGKSVATFTNMERDPTMKDDDLRDSVNDRLKAIFMGLLMEQVYAPDFEVTSTGGGPKPGYKYKGGYKNGKVNVGQHPETGSFHIERENLPNISDPEVERRLIDSMKDMERKINQHPKTRAATIPNPGDCDNGAEHIYESVVEEVVVQSHPDLTRDQQLEMVPHLREKIRIREFIRKSRTERDQPDEHDKKKAAARKIGADGKKFGLTVYDLDIDLIANLHPFESARKILAKDVDSATLRQVGDSIRFKREGFMSDEDARTNALRALEWETAHGRFPDIDSTDSWERLLAHALQRVYDLGSANG